MTQAVRYDRYGGPEVLRIVDLPTPEPAPGQVRVAVHAAGVNPLDWKLRSGLYSGGKPLGKPAGVGFDFAGTIDAVGSDVTGWAPGQAVFGQTRPGAAATHVLADPAALVAKPDWLSFEQAAALPAPTEAAHRTVHMLDIKAGQRLLIHAVAGGVGLVAAQLARARGATVIGTASAERHDLLRDFGVTAVTYGDGWADRVRAVAPDGVDAVLDASGRGVLKESVELAGSPDRVVTLADNSAADHGVRLTTSGQATIPEVFAEVLPLMERGDLTLPVTATYPLEQVAEAHRISEEGHLFGKIVIVVA
ncbi:NADP-dependent oxidoreductase [Haloactinopolyspora sp.]|uniref:NADP-dependent oxidoreductase n=1 Tax=Haloactinopolyspora sp. TaxID=1966353 RepID=UPI002638541B|nr:NADP-dependent oxidoreductase [Haloactinopolyspora sp.]